MTQKTQLDRIEDKVNKLCDAVYGNGGVPGLKTTVILNKRRLDGLETMAQCYSARRWGLGQAVFVAVLAAALAAACTLGTAKLLAKETRHETLTRNIAALDTGRLPADRL